MIIPVQVQERRVPQFSALISESTGIEVKQYGAGCISEFPANVLCHNTITTEICNCFFVHRLIHALLALVSLHKSPHVH